MKYQVNVLVIGESWHGSNSTSLARGFRELGCCVAEIGSNEFYPKGNDVTIKVIRRTLNSFFKAQFNSYILRYADTLCPDIVVLFKGSYCDPKTISRLKKRGAWVINYFPDISPYNHGVAIDTKIFSEIDHIYTTKSFALDDFKQLTGKENVSFLPHGCDPYTHRPVPLDKKLHWRCDVSFVGAWSPMKEKTISELLEALPGIKLNVWGPRWSDKARTIIRNRVINDGVYGDFYSMAINASKINLGLIQEKPETGISDDLITSRTFHIPAAGGFMLHKRTSDVKRVFKEEEEICCFDDGEELANKVKYYLEYENERLKIACAGRKRALNEHKLSDRANTILTHFDKRF